jgi:hypothetical protein
LAGIEVGLGVEADREVEALHVEPVARLDVGEDIEQRRPVISGSGYMVEVDVLSGSTRRVAACTLLTV